MLCLKNLPRRGLHWMLCVLLVGCHREQPKRVPPLPHVVVEAAQAEEVPVYREYPAQSLSAHPVEIVARVEGWIREQYFENGEEVTAGQLLYLIDPDPFIAEVDKARADLAVAKAMLFNAQQKYERNSLLGPVSAISQQELESLLAQYEEAKAQVEAAQAALALAELRLSYCEVTSPIAGQASATTRYVGDLVGPYTPTPLVTIVPPAPLWVQFMAVCDDLAALREQGQAGRPSVEVARPRSQWRCMAPIIFIDNQVIPHSNMLQVRVEIPNAEREILPGTYLTARLQRKVLHDAVTVPVEAVVRQASDSIVWVVDQNNQVDMHRVEVGPLHGTRVVLLSGLRVGERVVVQGQQRLKMGMHVEITPSEAPLPKVPGPPGASVSTGKGPSS